MNTGKERRKREARTYLEKMKMLKAYSDSRAEREARRMRELAITKK